MLEDTFLLLTNTVDGNFTADIFILTLPGGRIPQISVIIQKEIIKLWISQKVFNLVISF